MTMSKPRTSAQLKRMKSRTDWDRVSRAIASGEEPDMADPDDRSLPAEAFAQALAAAKRRRGERGPQKAPVKRQITLRLDADLLAALKADGRGWQTRANALLRKAMKLAAPKAPPIA